MYKIKQPVIVRRSDDKNYGDSEKRATPMGQRTEVRGFLVDHIDYESESIAGARGDGGGRTAIETLRGLAGLPSPGNHFRALHFILVAHPSALQFM